MIDRFLEQPPAICAALLSTEVRKCEKDVFTMNEAHITCAEEVLKALKPIRNATLVMSEESMPTLSVIAPLYSKLVMGSEESPDDTKSAKDIKAAIAQDLGKRYANERKTLCMASALDPRFKDLPFLSEMEIKETYSRMTDAVVAAIKKQQNEAREVEETDQSKDVEDHLSDYEDGSAYTSLQPIKRPRKSCTLADLLGMVFATSENNMAPKSAHDTAASEIKRFREEKPLPLQENPLSWWKEHEDAYPELSKLAKGFLCIPGTSVTCGKRRGGDIVTAHRSALTSEHIDQLIFLQKNLDIK
ncbi:E3 SUMO-protein ligase ZBED1-like isoform X2 [Silurus meridionalis]|uniref:E3 SUMO-protein ligase ZBED1-like isoform X2 n=1 Tax=Silurus meridionalis TaxID=175797 RepID=UPI001EEBDAAC|nr:E3 SUMO-protein ligase ZBED1-like isoform X2 [Silurus meridionalis]